MKIEQINLKYINLDPNNPRSKVDKEQDMLLQASIESEGQIEPILVEELGKNQYIVDEGNSRARVMKKSKKFSTINAIVSKKLSKEERLFKQITIDTHRKKWSNFDRDNAWLKLYKMGKYNPKSFAKKISESYSVIERFIKRADVLDVTKNMKNISASTVDEVLIGNKDKKTQTKILKTANKKSLGRIEVRKLAKVATKVSPEVFTEYDKGNISIDDVENMSKMKKENQKMALSSTKVLNTNKKQLKTMIEGKKITVKTKAIVLTSSQKINLMQEKFFKLSSDLRDMENLLDSLSAAEEQMAKAHMDKILSGVINELERQVLPSIKNFKKVLTRIRK